MSQLDLFTDPHYQSVQHQVQIDFLLGRAPEIVDRHSRYAAFDGEKARAAILEMCSKADDWVKSRAVSRAIKMHPSDLVCLARRMSDRGEIEITELYYGASDPREKDYQGYQWGYRLPGRTA